MVSVVKQTIHVKFNFHIERKSAEIIGVLLLTYLIIQIPTDVVEFYTLVDFVFRGF